MLNGLGCSAPSLTTCRDHLAAGLRHAPPSAAALRVVLLVNIGIVSWALGDMAEGLDRTEEARVLARRAGRTIWIANVLADLAFLRAEHGELDVASARADEAEALLGDLESVEVRARVEIIAGEVHRLVGDADGARARMRDVLRTASALGNQAFALRALRLHGQLLADAGAVDDG